MEQLESSKPTSDQQIVEARAAMARWYDGVPLVELKSYCENAVWAPGAIEAVEDLQHRNIHVAIASITWKFAVAWFAGKLNITSFLGTDLLPSGAIAETTLGPEARQWILEEAGTLRCPEKEELNACRQWMPDTYSHPEAMLADLWSLDRYTPLVQIAEVKVLADHRGKVPQLPYLNRLSEIDVPLLGLFSEGQLQVKLRGPEMVKSRDVTVHALEGFSHLDVIYGRKAFREVFQTCQDWLKVH